MKDSVRTWLTELRDNGVARRRKLCKTCSGETRVGRVEMAEHGWRACYWCPSCEALAYGSDSFLGTNGAELAALPIVKAPTVRVDREHEQLGLGIDLGGDGGGMHGDD
jgi:hypothetical protein